MQASVYTVAQEKLEPSTQATELKVPGDSEDLELACTSEVGRLIDKTAII